MTLNEVKALRWNDIKGMSYMEREEIGRTVYEHYALYPHQFTPKQYDKWDVSSTGETNTYNIEIKFRYITRERYDEEGYWLEKNKYDALMEAYEKTGSIPLYVNYLCNGVGYCWNLLNIKPVWQKKWATESTAEDSYGKKKVLKDVCFPKPNEGKELKW